MRSVFPRLPLLLSAAVLAGCGVAGIPQPPSLNLPQPISDFRAIRKGDNVFLAWTAPNETTDRLPVRRLGPTRVCRSVNVPLSDCSTSIAEIAAPSAVVSHTKPAAPTAAKQMEYTDKLSADLLSTNPGSQIFYAVSALNQHGRSAGLSNVVSVPDVPALSPPIDFRAQVTTDGVVLSWTGIVHSPESPELHHFYRVYRRQEGSNGDITVGELPLEERHSYVLLDHTFEWEKTYLYRATVAVTASIEGQPERQFEGDDTPSLKVFAHDIFPPAVPSGLQAAFTQEGQQKFIDLIWAPDTDADLAGYNVYRREEGSETVKINAELAKAPAFRDTNVASGHTYFYSVSAVDLRANESTRSPEAAEEVP